MKSIFIAALFVFWQQVVFAQDADKKVTLVVSGQGKTQHEAKQNAMRSAIEQAFGTFISTNTTLINDELVKDEIISYSSGNIQHFDIINEIQMSDGSFSSSIKATVSIGSLTKFCESKGINVEFKGGLFAANIKLQELNLKNEEKIFSNLYMISSEWLFSKSFFDYEVNISEPVKDYNDESKWVVKGNVKAKANNNANQLKEYISSTLENISLSNADLEFYKKSNIPYYTVDLEGKEMYYFRSNVTFFLYHLFEEKLPNNSMYFEISNGVDKATGSQLYSCFSQYIFDGGYEERMKEPNCVFIPLRDNFITADYPILYENGNHESSVSKICKRLMKEGAFSERYSRRVDNYIKIDLSNLVSDGFQFHYSFKNVFTIDQLSKITEYTVKPTL